MHYETEDTIVAKASAPGPAVRGIVRVSGPQTVGCVSASFQADDEQSLKNLKRPRVISGKFTCDDVTQPLPCDLYLWPGNRSYTAQPTAELHTIGSQPLLDAMVTTLCRHNARTARPGEFTLRAFLAGHLDLTQAEAVLGVIDARGEGQLQSALTQLAGGLSGPLSQLREQLLGLLAHLEAGLDFVEEDIEFITQDELLNQLSEIETAVVKLRDQMNTRQSSQSAPRVVLIGRPNVGKSSLMNRLAGEASTALVADQAGTTRDYLTKRVEIDGVECLLTDTAGIDHRVTGGIDLSAQQFSSMQAKQADLRVYCIDATSSSDTSPQRWSNDDDLPTLTVLTKCDLAAVKGEQNGAICTSSETGEGIPRLKQAIVEHLHLEPLPENVVASTATRCRDSLTQAAEALNQGQLAAREHLGEEIVAAELRHALQGLGEVVGEVYTDDVLDRVFSRFCIGK